MARVQDDPKVVKSLGFMPLLKKVWAEVGKDDVFTWGSALAYAWIFAIFPFLVFLLTLAPYMPGDLKKRAMDELATTAEQGLGEQGARPLISSVRQVMEIQQVGLLSIDLILSLKNASGGMNLTMK